MHIVSKCSPEICGSQSPALDWLVNNRRTTCDGVNGKSTRTKWTKLWTGKGVLRNSKIFGGKPNLFGTQLFVCLLPSALRKPTLLHKNQPKRLPCSIKAYIGLLTFKASFAFDTVFINKVMTIILFFCPFKYFLSHRKLH